VLFPLIEFGSLVFFILISFVCITEIAMLHKGEEATATGLFIVTVVVCAALVGGLPALTWHYLAGYLIGAFVWVPVYWYLTLRSNRRELMRCKERDRCDFGTEKDGRWLPKHPEYEALVANGLMWFIAAPIHCAKDWINWIIDLFTRLMNKIQASLAVEFEPSDQKQRTNHE
jgi:hypothetical protein